MPSGSGGVMGAGDYATGVGPAGFDPVLSSDGRSIYRAPAAQEFDGATRDFPLDDLGNFRALHPVDQGVAFSILVKRGQLKSAPNVGNTLHEIGNVGGGRTAEQVKARVNDAFPLRDFLREGSVETIRIDHDVTVRGRLLVVYTYRNTLLGKRSGEVTVRAVV
jgi:hypothetical protein